MLERGTDSKDTSSVAHSAVVFSSRDSGRATCVPGIASGRVCYENTHDDATRKIKFIRSKFTRESRCP